jgi:hypothetical protein
MIRAGLRPSPGHVEAQRTPRVRFIGEPIWAGRRADEILEATRHEALLNLAFAGAPVTIQCPYDTSRLDPEVLADAERTHPELVGRRPGSGAHGGRGVWLINQLCDLVQLRPTMDGVTVRLHMRVA